MKKKLRDITIGNEIWKWKVEPHDELDGVTVTIYSPKWKKYTYSVTAPNENIIIRPSEIKDFILNRAR